MTMRSISRIRNTWHSCDLWDVDLAAGTHSTCLPFCRLGSTISRPSLSFSQKRRSFSSSCFSSRLLLTYASRGRIGLLPLESMHLFLLPLCQESISLFQSHSTHSPLSMKYSVNMIMWKAINQRSERPKLTHQSSQRWLSEAVVFVQ